MWLSYIKLDPILLHGQQKIFTNICSMMQKLCF